MTINPVGTWQDPDFNSQTGTEYKTNLDNVARVAKRFVDRFAAREAATPDMTVEIDAGYIWDGGGGLTERAAQTTATITAPSGNPRIDRIVVDRSTGDHQVVAGSEAASPVAPAIPDGKDPVCQIALDNSPATTAITNALIDDERVGAETQPKVLPDLADAEEGGVLQVIGGAYKFVTKAALNPFVDNMMINPSGVFVSYRAREFELGNPWSAADGEILVDRWHALQSTADGVKVSISETGGYPVYGYPAFATPERNSGTGKFGIMQIIDRTLVSSLTDADAAAGDRISASCAFRQEGSTTNLRMYLMRWAGGTLVPEAVISSWNAAGADPTFGTSWTSLGGTGNIALSGAWTTAKLEDVDISGVSLSDEICLLIITDDTGITTSDGFDFAQAKVNPGPVASPFVPRPPQIESLLIQRYVNSFFGGDLVGFVKNSTTVLVGATRPVELQEQAVAPVVTLLDTSPSFRIGGGTSTGSGSSIAASATENDLYDGHQSFIFEIDGFTGLTTGQGAVGSTGLSMIRVDGEY